MSLLGVYNGNQSGEATGADKYNIFTLFFRLVNTYLCLLQLSPDSLPSILILLYAVPDINNTTTGYYTGYYLLQYQLLTTIKMRLICIRPDKFASSRGKTILIG